ncbi:MAG: phospholipase A [Gammaproteobacteria bacterium]|jgi:phospholipase A1|nr:phospholipase A [Gammaproteobacteria bacterium]
MKRDLSRRTPATLALLLTLAAQSGVVCSQDAKDACLEERMRTAPDTMTLGEVRRDCVVSQPASGPTPRSVMGDRRAFERASWNNPFVLTAHRPNYVLPLTWVRLPAREDGTGRHDFELQFQLSQKVLLAEGAIAGHGALYVAYTNRSFWQAYSRDRSAPFRETIHEPELILSFDSDWSGFGIRMTGYQLVLNHQSNGRGGADSRSWHRVILNALFEKDAFVFALRPWWRIPEDEKSSAGDAVGDDNPDIERYYGQMEVSGAWMRGTNLYSFTLRNNLRSDSRGSIELGWSFPVYRSIRASVHYFSGYGESLINYNRSSQSLGLGFLFTDWL